MSMRISCEYLIFDGFEAFGNHDVGHDGDELHVGFSMLGSHCSKFEIQIIADTYCLVCFGPAVNLRDFYEVGSDVVDDFCVFLREMQ